MRIVEHSGLAHTRWGRAFGVTHGPKVWPWWKPVSFSVVPLAPYEKCYHRLWVYTRWGDAWCIEWQCKPPAPNTPKWWRLRERRGRRG